MELQEFIAKGFIQNPYQEFTMTIPAGTTTRPTQYNFNYFALLSADNTGIQVKFGNSGNFTDLIGAGIGVSLPIVVENVQFSNPTGSDIQITFALAIGEIFDRRLAISGNVNVQNTTANPLFVTNPTGDRVAVHDSQTLGRILDILRVYKEQIGFEIDFLSPKTPKGAQNAAYSAASGVQTIFSPGANTNGAIIRKSEFTSGGEIIVVADTSAPSSAGDTTKDWIAKGIYGTGVSVAAITRDFIVPAGNGLYAVGSGNLTGFVSYDFI